MFLSDPGDRDLDDVADDEPAPPSRRRRIVMRVFGLLALTGLVLPGIVLTVQVAGRTADRACRVYVAADARDAIGYRVRFELFGRQGPGWTCSAIQFGGRELYMTGMGPIPALPGIAG